MTRDYIARKSGSSDVADNYLKRMIDAVDELSFLSKKFPPYRGGAWRMMPFDNYLVLFEVADDEVQIIHIRHAARRTSRR